VGSKLPFPLWFHGAAIQEDRLYVWGGLMQVKSDTTNAKLISAQVTRAGEISAWRDEQQPMPFPVYSGGFCGFNDYLVAAAGRYSGGHPTNVIWFDRLEKGVAQPWRYVETDMDARIYHSLGLDKARGWIYITGGQNKLTRTATRTLIDSVQVFTLKQPIQTRLDSVKTGTASATPTPTPSAQVAGKSELIFFKMDDAMRLAGQANRNVLAFFYAPEVPTCRRFYDTVMQSEEFKQYASKFVLAAVDTSKPENQPLLGKYVIFKVPSLVEMRADGGAVRSTFRMRTIEDFREFASGK
jgi:thiol-disulfide isomerase/thioredoxin